MATTTLLQRHAGEGETIAEAIRDCLDYGKDPEKTESGKYMQELHAAIASLPNKQAKRIYAHFILGMTKQDIARAEGVHEKVVRVAIERGLRHLEKILKNSL